MPRIQGGVGMSSVKATILAVDDDVQILRMIKRILELEGYPVLTACNSRDALNLFYNEAPDLVLLDIIMSDMDGYAVCQYIHQFSRIPIIMITARCSEQDIIRGLDTGADDYITKPFSSSELIARIRAVLRRLTSENRHMKPIFHSRDLTIHFTRHIITLDGQKLDLSTIEYKLLSYMAQNVNRVVVPDQILENVWGEGYIGTAHLVNVNINRLRKKLKDSSRYPSYIITRPGIGYMMVK